MSTKVALITGAARRIGAAIARYLHQQGMNVVIHYRESATEAEGLCKELNTIRSNSAITHSVDLLDTAQLTHLIEKSANHWGRLDALINNASSFYPTPVGTVTEGIWQDLLGSNLQAPFFLAQAAVPYLAKQQGSIVNITDVHATRPLGNYSVYSIAKAGVVMLTKSLAKDLAPHIRVNAVAPGNILWPEGNSNTLDQAAQAKLLTKIPLQRQGQPIDIAKAIWFFIHEAPYVTGQILHVDGGKSL